MLDSTGKKLILILCLMVLIVEVSYAAEVCQCDKGLVNEFTFTNTKLTTQHYSIRKGGAAASWTAVTPMTFTLKPSESKSIVAFTTIPCSTPIGLYSLDIIALSEDTSLKQTLNFEVNTCHDFDVVTESLDVCVDDYSLIPIALVNKGIYPETIQLTSDYPLSVNSINLSVNDSAIVNVMLTTDFIGEFKVNVQASNEYRTINKTFSINSIACRFFGTDFDYDVVQLCEDDELLLNLKVVNEARTNKFYFLTESEFISLPEEVTLSPNQVYNAPLIISSKCSPGIESTNITVYTNGSERLIIPLTIDFRSCYQPIVMSVVKKTTACACSDNVYEFKLYNPGSKTVKYALSASLGDIYYDNAKADSITLSAQSEALLKVRHKLPCDFLGEHNYSLTATSISVCNKSSSDQLSASIKSWSDCESVDLSGIADYRIINEQTVIPVTVKNIGNLVTGYDIIVSGSVMPYLMGVSDSFITLEPGQQQVIELSLNPVNETDAFLTVQALSEDSLAGDSLTIYFHSGLISYKGLYYLVIPASVIVISSLLFFRKKKILTKSK